MQVGRLYAEQDEVDALIAEEELKLVPDDEEIKKGRGTPPASRRLRCQSFGGRRTRGRGMGSYG
ncbi:MAG: hypothetical protein IPP63_07775 [Chloracidobacterium sp.]|nr:hypothetical protein [Chloracidobacterium sp.]